jgi:hypothetical protein
MVRDSYGSKLHDGARLSILAGSNPFCVYGYSAKESAVGVRLVCYLQERWVGLSGFPEWFVRGSFAHCLVIAQALKTIKYYF